MFNSFNLPDVPRPGVSEYISGSGALSALDDRLSIFKKPLLLADSFSYEAFKKFYPGNREFQVVLYEGPASFEGMKDIADSAEEGIDIIIGAGGGRILDTTKGVAEFLNVEYITIPTVIATCACYAPVAAVYYPDKTFRAIHSFKRTAYACIADLDLLVDSPKAFLIAGIGDTLAKWYEASALVEKFNMYDKPLVRLGLEAAKLTREFLLKNSKEALEAMDKKEVSEAFKNCVDTVFPISACVGSFAVQYGRTAGAHAIHNGLSLIKDTHSVLHGTKVSYGILVQLVAQGKIEEAKELVKFYKENNLAYNLACVNITEDVENKIKTIATFAASPEETFVLAIDNCTPEVVAEAMRKVETL